MCFINSFTFIHNSSKLNSQGHIYASSSAEHTGSLLSVAHGQIWRSRWWSDRGRGLCAGKSRFHCVSLGAPLMDKCVSYYVSVEEGGGVCMKCIKRLRRLQSSWSKNWKPCDLSEHQAFSHQGTCWDSQMGKERKRRIDQVRLITPSLPDFNKRNP